MPCKTILLCYTLSVISTFSNSARILGIISIPSYSHQFAFRPLWKELSLRGHQITLITPDPIRDLTLRNLTEIDIHFSYDIFNKVNKELNMNQNNSSRTKKEIFFSTYSNIVDMQLQHPQVKALIGNKYEVFDLLMVEFLWPFAWLAFAERFKCPFIGIVSLEPTAVIYEVLGNPIHPVLYPDFWHGFSDKLTFRERLISVFFYIYMKSFILEEFSEFQNFSIGKHFGKHYSTLQEVSDNISMLFVHTNPVIHPIRPLVPTIIDIGGGSHLKSAEKLSGDIEKVLNDASKGFIYFSMGTVVKCKDLPEGTLNILLETFANLPYTIIWKFEDEIIKNKSDNVFTFKWVPQQSVLNHKNIKLFITHGGLHSTEEAMHAHVPIIGLPVVRDQIGNVKKIQSKGMGIYMDYNNLDTTTLEETVLEVINNPRYRENLKRSAELIQDQPMTGLEKAIWWTKYVLRHKGASHLRSPALDLPAYQYYLLDAIGFCLAVIVIAIYLIITVTKLICKLCKLLTTNV